jgi:hypothetical protein
MSNYTFKPGEYLTRDGRKAVVLCDDAPDDFSLVGYVHRPNGAGVIPETWKPDGRSGVGPQDRDLLPPVQEQQEVVRWVVLWNSGSASTADIPPPFDARPMMRACTRVVLTPGRFDTEDSPSEWNAAIDAADKALWELGYTLAHEAVIAVSALRRPS